MAIGLADHESRARRLNANMRGTHYVAHNRLPTLAPLQWLQPQDVLAYHHVQALPWLRIYTAADNPVRARSELSMATGAGDPLRRVQRWQEIRDVYPELAAVWESRWPEYLGR